MRQIYSVRRRQKDLCGRVDRSGGDAVAEQQCEDCQELQEQAMTVGGPSRDARDCAAEHYGGGASDGRSTIIDSSYFFFFSFLLPNFCTAVTLCSEIFSRQTHTPKDAQ